MNSLSGATMSVRPHPPLIAYSHLKDGGFDVAFCPERWLRTRDGRFPVTLLWGWDEAEEEVREGDGEIEGNLLRKPE